MRVYLAGVHELMALLRDIAEDHHNVLLLRHNPGIADLANYLKGSQIENMPTCGLLGLELQAPQWDQLKEVCALLFYYDSRKIADK